MQKPHIIDSKQLATMDLRHRWLVEDVLVQGQPAIMGGAKKCLKTTLAMDLAISLGSGLPFLGRFRVPERQPVLILSGESGAGTIQETALRICAAKGIGLEQCSVLWGFELPRMSQSKPHTDLTKLLQDDGIKLLIVDPLYLCLLNGDRPVSASNLYEVGPVLRSFAEACDNAGTTLMLVHHATKASSSGAKANKIPTLDDLAFAGVAEFARQWVLLARPEEYEPGSGQHELTLAIGGSAGHSGCYDLSISEGVLGKDLRGRHWSVNVIPHDREDGLPRVSKTPLLRPAATTTNRRRSRIDDDLFA